MQVEVNTNAPKTAMAAALAKVSVTPETAVAAAKPAVKVAASVKPVTTAVKSAVPAKKVAASVKPTTTVRPVAPPSAAPEVEDPELDPGSAIQNIVTSTAAVAAAPAPVVVAQPMEVAETPQPEAEDETSDSVELPSNVEMNEVDTNPEGVGFTIRIFGTGCLECSCLVNDPELEQIPENKLPSCHFTKGQDLCPARAVYIQPVGTRVLFVRKWLKAKAAGDANRILRFTKELSEMETGIREEIMREVGLLAS